MTLVEIKETLMKKMNDNILEACEYAEDLQKAIMNNEADERCASLKAIVDECYHSACEDIRIMRELKLITQREERELLDAAADRISGEDVEFYNM